MTPRTAEQPIKIHKPAAATDAAALVGRRHLTWLRLAMRPRPGC
jgi:hypothetical protein